MDQSIIDNIKNRLQYAKSKHPEGASMLALLDEVSEARYAQKNQDRSSYTSELLDVIVVAIRLIQKERENGAISRSR